jgi:hypothetical protein
MLAAISVRLFEGLPNLSVFTRPVKPRLVIHRGSAWAGKREDGATFPLGVCQA